MLPYAVGHERPVERCIIDRPYRRPKRALLPLDLCLADANCSSELSRLDQRRPADASSGCRSPFGALDMNGHVNEWVDAERGRYPHRGALKGGWWGPVRNRCRPAVRSHREDHYGYEIGFRCCGNVRDPMSTSD
jgi:formylglycine-generating enzyme required for sulfatase activity